MRGGIGSFVALTALSAFLIAAPALAASRKSQPDEPKKEAAFPTEIPAGPLQIVISIKNQRGTLYSNGKPIITTPVSTGVPDHPTPTGVFSILQKRTWHESNIYSAAPMPFMQRITWSGVALHEGVVPGHPASHGCIRLPHEFANWLFGITDLGVRVVVAEDEPKVEEISHPFLFTAKSTANAPRDTGSIYRASSLAQARKLASLDADAGVEQDAARINTVSVFVSRKEGRLFVRRNFAPLFDAPVRIDDRQRPLGTHVFTAMGFKNGGPEMRWSVISMKSGEQNGELHDRYSLKERWIDGRPVKTAWYSRERWTPQSASEVLDRIEIPRDVAERISELLTPGSSLIVSDEGLNKETRKHTDFVVLTAPGQFVSADPDEQENKERQDNKRRPSRQERAAAVSPVAPLLPQRADIDISSPIESVPQPAPAVSAVPAMPAPQLPDTRIRADEPQPPPAPESKAAPPQPNPQADLAKQEQLTSRPDDDNKTSDLTSRTRTDRNSAASRAEHSVSDKAAETKVDRVDTQQAADREATRQEQEAEAPGGKRSKASLVQRDEGRRANEEVRPRQRASRDDDDEPEVRRVGARIISVDPERSSRSNRSRRNAAREEAREKASEALPSRSRRESVEADAPERRAAASSRAGTHQIDLLPP